MKKRERGQGGRGWEGRGEEEKKGERTDEEQRQIPGGLQFQVLCAQIKLFSKSFFCVICGQCPQAVILSLSIKIKQEKKRHTKVYNINKKSKSGPQSYVPAAPTCYQHCPQKTCHHHRGPWREHRGGRMQGWCPGLRSCRSPVRRRCPHTILSQEAPDRLSPNAALSHLGFFSF